jgi:hypothetical protein
MVVQIDRQIIVLHGAEAGWPLVLSLRHLGVAQSRWFS